MAKMNNASVFDGGQRSVRARPDPSSARAPRSAQSIESPLGWLHARGIVSERQFMAGERLRVDFTIAGLAPRVTMRWDAMPRAPHMIDDLDPVLAQIAAKDRFHDAIAATGQGLGDILWRVVCAGEGLEMAERGLGWPRRAAKLVLTMALDRIADHYKLP